MPEPARVDNLQKDTVPGSQPPPEVGGPYAYYGDSYAYEPAPYVVHRRGWGVGDPYNQVFGPQVYRSNNSPLDPAYYNPNQ